jgi:hypothetical protein
MFRYAVLAFLITIFPMLSHASFYDGNRLMQWAEADDRITAGKASIEDLANSSRLYGYVTGVHDGRKDFYCRPSKVSSGQVVALVKQFLAQHPDKWREPAEVIVGTALTSAFPCPKK